MCWWAIRRSPKFGGLIEGKKWGQREGGELAVS